MAQDTEIESEIVEHSVAAWSIEQAVRMMANQYQSTLNEMLDYPPSASEIRDAGVRGTVTVSIFDGHVSDLDGNLIAAAAWLQDQLSAVPFEFRSAATLETISDEYSASLTIQYPRPETDEEWSARKSDVERRAALAQTRQAEKERAEFERLKAKFGAAEDTSARRS